MIKVFMHRYVNMPEIRLINEFELEQLHNGLVSRPRAEHETERLADVLMRKNRRYDQQ